MAFLSLSSLGAMDISLGQRCSFSSIFLCQGPGFHLGEPALFMWDSVAVIASCLSGAGRQEDRNATVTNGNQEARDLDTYCLPSSFPPDLACV